MVEAPRGGEHAPRLAFGVDESAGGGDQRPDPASERGVPVEAVPDPPVEAAHDAHLDGVDQAPPVAQVGVDQGARDAGLGGDLVEGQEQRVVFDQEAFGGVDDQTSTYRRVEPGGTDSGHGRVSRRGRETC